jgi:predicted alpha/beta-fold hydrolase
VPQPPYRRERIYTDDDDFLDLDWLQSGHKRLVIVSHGLEGDTNRNYVTGMAKAVNDAGWDVLAWNFRGCGGEINRQPRFTHNGATEDLNAVIKHALVVGNYNSVALVGFSMGGNLTLMYLGREADNVPDEVNAAVCFSVPCDLAAASSRLAESFNAWEKRFVFRQRTFQRSSLVMIIID